jgi:hypothetical protein
MRAAEMVFWIDQLDPAHPTDGPGVLCARHADAIVVPRNWTLDDLRDPDLHLFRPPAPAAATVSPRTRTHRAAPLPPPTLPLGEPERTPGEAVTGRADAGQADPNQIDQAATERAAEAEPWTPAFDVDSDLDGLLAARSPLLSRAFRGTDRPRPT